MNFIPNRGQLDERVAFYIRGTDKTIFFNSEGLTFVLTKAGEKRRTIGQESQTPNDRIRPDPEASPGFPPDSGPAADLRWVVKLDFLGARPAVKPVGMDKTGTVISYFSGPSENWKSGLSTYSRIIYRDLWPGIDLVYSGTMDRLKYEFVVHPGADPSRIRLAYRGASSVVVNTAVAWLSRRPAGGFEDGEPSPTRSERGRGSTFRWPIRSVDDGHGQHGPGTAQGKRRGSRHLWFFGRRSTTGPGLLVLDPMILIYCGYLGGPSYDYGYGIAADNDGRAYVTGYTYSTGLPFPAKVGPDRTFNGGSMDVFVAKLNA